MLCLGSSLSLKHVSLKTIKSFSLSDDLNLVQFYSL